MKDAKKEINTNYIEMSISQYAEHLGGKVSKSTIRRRCQQRELDAYQLSDDVEGSKWIIRVPIGKMVPIEDYIEAMQEVSRLQTIIKAIQSLAI